MNTKTPGNGPQRSPRALFVTAAVLGQLLVFATAFGGTNVLSTCEAALVELQTKISSIKSEPFFNQKDLSNEITVRQTSTRRGRHGGRILTLEKQGASWVSSYRSIGYDPQGDPRWFISVAGADTARFFGFRVIDDTHCEVPDPDEFNGALAKINTRLRARGQEPVSITFYPTPDNENVKVTEYLRHFRDDGGIPLARSGNHLIHDLSFHTASIFLPPEVVKYKRRETAFLEKFIAKGTAKYAAHPEQSQSFRKFAFTWRMIQTTEIDNGTGTLAPGLTSYEIETDPVQKQKSLNSPINWLLSSGESPFAHVSELIDDLDSVMDQPGQNPVESWKKNRKALESISQTSLHSDLVRFLKEEDPHPWLFPDRYDRYAGLASNDRLCLEITRRRALISEIALELSQPPMARAAKILHHLTTR